MSGTVTEFIKRYNEVIVPKLNKLEAERQKILKKALNLLYSSLFALIIGIIMIIFLVFNYSDNIELFFVILVITIFAIPCFVLNDLIQKNRDFIKDVKKKCMKDYIYTFGGAKWSSKTQSLTQTETYNCGLFSDWTHHETDDIFHGCYNDVTYSVIETKLLKYIPIAVTRQGSTMKISTTAFQGIVIKFPCNKKIGSRTIVATQGDNNILGLPTGTVALGLGILIYFFLPYIMSGYWYFDKNILPMQLSQIAIPLVILIWQIMQIILEKIKLKDLKRITLEDSNWNKRFKVYSNDEVEARYLVTTAFMERFLNLNTAFGTKKAKCSFYDDKIMFAISTKRNLFEIGNLFKPINDKKCMQKFFHEYKSIIDMIEYFKLNEKTNL